MLDVLEGRRSSPGGRRTGVLTVQCVDGEYSGRAALALDQPDHLPSRGPDKGSRMSVVLKILIEDIRAARAAWVVVIVATLVVPPLALALPLIEKQLIDQAILPRQVTALLPLISLFAILWIANTIISAVAGVIQRYLIERLTNKLREELYTHFADLSLAFARREHSANILSLFVNDVPVLVSLLSSVGFSLLGGVVTLCLAIIAMLSLNWQLALAAGLLPPVLSLGAWILTRPLRPAMQRIQAKTAEVNERIQESLTGLREIVAFGQQHAQSQQISTGLAELLRLRVRMVIVETGIGTAQGVLSLAVSVVILGYGGYLVINGHTTLGTLVAMRSLFGYAFTPAKQLAGLFGTLQKARGAAQRIEGFLAESPQVVESSCSRPLTQVNGSVTFQNVSFAYTDDCPVLSDVTFHVNPGQFIALVGPSGAGKSTLTSLLCRFYDPTCGQVLLDGVDLRNISLVELRKNIGMVFQDTFLFAGSIRENLLFGKSDASAEEIVAGLRSANAWEFVQNLPDGLNTRVGERGVRFSEGQKQRLAIARAFLRNPRILILDEPTSALDARSEALFQSALAELVQGRTTFVIAHRLSTVMRADVVLVLSEGRLVEQGPPADLLRTGGVFRELYDLQFSDLATDKAVPNDTAKGEQPTLIKTGAP